MTPTNDDKEAPLWQLAQEAAGILWRRFPQEGVDADTASLIELWRVRYQKALDDAGV